MILTKVLFWICLLIVILAVYANVVLYFKGRELDLVGNLSAIGVFLAFATMLHHWQKQEEAKEKKRNEGTYREKERFRNSGRQWIDKGVSLGVALEEIRRGFTLSAEPKSRKLPETDTMIVEVYFQDFYGILTVESGKIVSFSIPREIDRRR